MAIVMTIDYGPGKGKTFIDDSFVVKTKEEVDRIYETVSRNYYEAMFNQKRRKLDKQNK